MTFWLSIYTPVKRFSIYCFSTGIDRRDDMSLGPGGAIVGRSERKLKKKWKEFNRFSNFRSHGRGSFLLQQFLANIFTDRKKNEISLLIFIQ